MDNFAAIRLRAPFVRWLKAEAARQGTTMYVVLESAVARGLGGMPWGSSEGARPRRKKGRRKSKSVF